MTTTSLPSATITAEDRTLAALTHLSGLAGYILPLVIWWVKSESVEIAGIAKQAILLNVVVFVTIVATALLWLTLILIPLVILFWCVLGAVALVLPIVGAVKASQGDYYQYPVVGLPPG